MMKAGYVSAARTKVTELPVAKTRLKCGHASASRTAGDTAELFRYSVVLLARVVTLGLCFVGAAVNGEELDEYLIWPGDPRGLVFVWQDAAAQNEILDARGKVERICRVRAHGRAKFGRFDVMDVTGGSFVAEDLGSTIANACRATGQFTLEAVVTPAASDQTALVISSRSRQGESDFALRQSGDRFTADLAATPESVRGDAGRAQEGKPAHVVVTRTANQLTTYVNGKQVSIEQLSGSKPTDWTADEMRFGSSEAEESQWAGAIEGVAVYSRALPADEVAQHFRLHQSRVAGREPAERVVVDARLVATSSTPTPEEIAPYERALAVYTYEVQNVVEGDCQDKRIQVAHWVIMDRRTLPNERQRGQQMRLVLEEFEDHEQLESERLVSDSEEYDLPLYYDVEP